MLYVKSNNGLNDGKLMIEGLIQKIVDQLSEDILLPVDIKSVKVVEVN